MCRKLIYLTFVVLLIGLAAVNQASAECGVIYYDDFGGSGSMNLDGTTPDITTNGATWQAGPRVKDDGSYGGTAGQMFTAALPFIPDIGAVYELSATVDNSGDWIGIGFLKTTTVGKETRFSNNNPVLWSQVRQSGVATKDKAYIGPGVSNPVNDSNTSSAAKVKVRIETNSLTDWRVTWYFDGSQQFQRTINPDACGISINYVAFGSNGQTTAYSGTISSFKLVIVPVATSPSPADNSLVNSTTVSLQWKPGECAAKHDVYLGVNFADVNNATTSTPDIYKGRQDSNNYNAAGLIPKTTYYWRIDEVNDNDPNIWRGRIWSFKVELLTAYNPSPANGAKDVDHNADLAWSPGFKANKHDVYLGTDKTKVTGANSANPSGVLKSQGQSGTTFEPGTLKFDTTYYWRIDEVNDPNLWPGDVWSFKTGGPRCIATEPDPNDLATDVPPDMVLGWKPGVYADKHNVYLGTDETTMMLVSENQDANTYDPCGLLEFGRTYCWRIDEVNEVNEEDPWLWPGDIWRFTVAGYRIVDNFESYNPSLANTWKTGGNATVSLSMNPVHEGKKAMAYSYKDDIAPYYSEAKAATTGPNGLEIDPNWLAGGAESLSLWFKGRPACGGSFRWSDPNYIMTACGAGIPAGDIGPYDELHDEFHYAWIPVSEDEVTIVAKVKSITRTNSPGSPDPWAKAGVMMRVSADADSAHVMACVTPGNGVRFQHRETAGGPSTDNYFDSDPNITAPCWLRLKAILNESGTWFDVYPAYSTCGPTGEPNNWITVGSIQLSTTTPPLIGLSLTAHNTSATCTAVFSNVTVNGAIPPSWTSQDIGIKSNTAEPMYVALEDGDSPLSLGTVYHLDGPNVTQEPDWTEWRIDLLDEFQVQDVNLSNVRRMYIGFGDKDFPEPGGSGIVYFDDIRLYPSCRPEMRPTADFTNDCVVDFRDLAILANEWLVTGYPIADLYVDHKVDFRDFAILAEHWLEEKLLP